MCNRGDHLIIDDVVRRAHVILAPYIRLSTAKVFGFEDRIEWLERTLSLGQDHNPSDHCLLAGLYGMGGVGKSTLARVLYDKTALKFRGRCVYLEVGEKCNGESLRSKRCELIMSMSGSSWKPAVSTVPAERQRLHDALRAGPMFLVLDDLWTDTQLHWLLACDDTDEDPEAVVAQLPAGSRILLISRNRRIVEVEGHIERVKLLTELDDQSSKRLLCQKAFRSSASPPDFTERHMKDALSICGGLPLALQVLGGQLKQAKAHGVGWQVNPPTLPTQRSLVPTNHKPPTHLPDCLAFQARAGRVANDATA